MGCAPGYPGDRKCLLPVASCLFPTSHFSVCLPPAGPTPLTQPSHQGGAWKARAVGRWGRGSRARAKAVSGQEPAVRRRSPREGRRGWRQLWAPWGGSPPRSPGEEASRSSESPGAGGHRAAARDPAPTPSFPKPPALDEDASLSAPRWLEEAAWGPPGAEGQRGFTKPLKPPGLGLTVAAWQFRRPGLRARDTDPDPRPAP